jgi:RNA polymerase sigma factor (sigma-70 family)
VPAASDDPKPEVTPEGPAVRPLDYEQYFREHRNRLASFARRNADNAQQGEDALQEAMIDAYEKWPEVSIMEHPRGWVAKVISRKLYRLRQRREDPSPVTDEAVQDSSEGLAEKSEIWAAVGELPPRQREIVTMRFELDLEIEEIAVALDIKESTVRGTLSRATQRLKDTLTAARRAGER